MPKHESCVSLMENLFPPARPDYTASSRSFSDADRSFLLDALRATNVDCPLR